MSSADSLEHAPAIVLRIPGPWTDATELSSRLPNGFAIVGDALYSPDGPPVGFEVMPPDEQFPEIFSLSCRRPAKPTELSGVQCYRMSAAVVGSAGSLLAASHMLSIGASIIQAGGVGVFIDNSAMSHGAADWLELASAEDPLAITYAFVNILGAQRHFATIGMHVLGQRDLVISRRGDEEQNLRSLEDFVRQVHEREDWMHGSIYRDQQGRSCQLVEQSGNEVALHTPAPHPMHNPNGWWRVEVCQ